MSQELKRDRGEWFVTVSGRRVFVCDPRPEDIDLGDIAHALAHVCRFGGHCNPFYSVAQHSVHVSEILEEVDQPALDIPPAPYSSQYLALVGLLHDATEAYVGDVIRPLKLALDRYQEIEARWWLAIATHFRLPWELPPLVKYADLRALATERRDLLIQSPWITQSLMKADERGHPPTERGLIPLAPADARRDFLHRYRILEPSRRLEGGAPAEWVTP